MADWYASSAAYSAIAAFVPSAVYTVGNIVKPTAPALKAQWVFRCTTAGTASTEPTWSTAQNNNATITTGGATFTNVTGQSTYGWSAAAGDLPTLLGAGGTFRFVGGDRMFVSSDHAETQSTTTDYGSGASAGAGWTSSQVLSVNRAGSVPPVAADLTAGASVTVSGAATIMSLDALFPVYHYGMNYIYTGSFTTAFQFNAAGQKTTYLDTCQLYVNTASATVRITASASASLVLYNSTVRFGATTQLFSVPAATTFEITWLGGSLAGAIFPSVLFSSPSSVTARGVDLSAITGTLVTGSAAVSLNSEKYLFDSCRIAPGVVRYTIGGSGTPRDLVELVNCFDGTNIINETYQPAGAVTTEFAITLSGGATDNVGTFSHKMVTGGTNVDKLVQPLFGFWLDVNNTAIGSSKTATVEIISSASLNNDEISLVLEYLGTASSSLATLATSLPATVLTAASAVTTSTATWNASPATPVKQKMQVVFTPRTAGRVRAQVRLGKASTTVYVDPQVTIT